MKSLPKVKLETLLKTLLIITPVLNFKAIGQLVMEIMHLEDFGDTKVSSTNAVLVLI